MTELFKRSGEEELLVAHMVTGEPLERGFLPAAPFLCGIILDDSGWSPSWLGSLIGDLIQYGAAYFAFLGSRCEEAHDLADVVRERFAAPSENDVVMTTWHDAEPLDEYLDFLLVAACPTEGYDFSVRRRFVLNIGREARPGLVAAIQLRAQTPPTSANV